MDEELPLMVEWNPQTLCVFQQILQIFLLIILTLMRRNNKILNK